MQVVEITIAPDGTPTIKVNGVAGTACKDVTKTVERALGTVTADKPTPEMYQQTTANHVHH
ncbi:MAG: DUF2997 domain-containing protein [Candidatus Paceibacterota bacterium]|jgi:hypothetical protein